MRRGAIVLIAVCLTLAVVLSGRFVSWGQQTAADVYIRSPRLGLAHISAATGETSPERYRHALSLGAGWNRWPLYWNWVQTAPDAWDWADYDRQVSSDLSMGLQINAILLGRPEFYADDEAVIAGLNAPIFADGTDQSGPDQQLNAANPWARFVYEVVSRYRPGGILSESGALLPGAGVRVWEVWNEPDHEIFWQGSTGDYARLLKVAYIVARWVDPQSQVMLGGLLYNTDVNWLAQVLSIYRDDPTASANNWFMDIVAVHSYGNPWRSGWLTLYVRETLSAYGLARPIWLNETGVPVWDDYPGPVWIPNAERRATSQQQAWFFIQSAVYAWSEGAEVVIFHQLYDDCGDQPAGTTFPPHGGELCVPGAVCSGDAFGIYRNLPTSVCFNQHPQPGTPRPIARAYRLAAEVFGAQPFGGGERQAIDERAAVFTFQRPASGEQITVAWNRTITEFALSLPASGANAQVFTLENTGIITPENGAYSFTLPPAQSFLYPEPAPGDQSAIGGPPLILIERLGGAVQPVTLDLEGPVAATMAPPPPTIPPTLDPALDSAPPIAWIVPLPEVSPPTFNVSWEAQDESGIESYTIWVRVDGGTWQTWLQTAQTSAIFTGSPGRTYEFAAWAVDLAGNWSENIDLEPQAVTTVE